MAAPERVISAFPANPTPEDRCKYVHGLSEEDLAAVFGEPTGYLLINLEMAEISVPLRQYDHPEEGTAFVLGADLVGTLLRAADEARAMGDHNTARELESKANDFAARAHLSPSTNNLRFRFSQDSVNRNLL